jgi:hypothetical protein
VRVGTAAREHSIRPRGAPTVGWWSSTRMGGRGGPVRVMISLRLDSRWFCLLFLASFDPIRSSPPPTHFSPYCAAGLMLFLARVRQFSRRVLN